MHSPLKSNFGVETYCKVRMTVLLILLSGHCCGVAPVRVETETFETLQVEDWKCPCCDVGEDKAHVL